MKPLIIFVLGFALRAALIVANPPTWGADTIIRLFDRHTLVKAHQLPMLQILISAISAISMDHTLVRYMMAVIGAIAGVGFYRMATDLVGDKWAFPGALLFVTHPYILAVSTVPFQEILMLAGVLFAFHFFYNERWLAASLALAVACLTRYEAWACCPVFAIAYMWRGNRTVLGLAKGILLFCWMPIAWIVWRHGLTDTGHFVVESTLSIWRLQRYVYLGWITVKFTPLPVLLLAAAGALLLYENRSRIDYRWWMQIAFVALFCIAIPFSAHGVMPDPERYVTSREAHIPMHFVLILAVVGLARWPRWNRAIVASSVVLGTAVAFWYANDQSSKPDIQVDYQVANYFDRVLQDGEKALLLAKPVSGETAQLYLDKARQTGGEEGLRQAQHALDSSVQWPPDFQRVAVYSRLGQRRFLAQPDGCTGWLAVWNDYASLGDELAHAERVQVLQSGPASVAILRRDCSR